MMSSTRSKSLRGTSTHWLSSGRTMRCWKRERRNSRRMGRHCPERSPSTPANWSHSLRIYSRRCTLIFKKSLSKFPAFKRVWRHSTTISHRNSRKSTSKRNCRSLQTFKSPSFEPKRGWYSWSKSIRKGTKRRLSGIWTMLILWFWSAESVSRSLSQPSRPISRHG